MSILKKLFFVSLIAIPFLLFVRVAKADSTLIEFGDVANYAGAGWTNITNVEVLDNEYANNTNGTYTNNMRFAFQTPENSVEGSFESFTFRIYMRAYQTTDVSAWRLAIMRNNKPNGGQPLATTVVSDYTDFNIYGGGFNDHYFNITVDATDMSLADIQEGHVVVFLERPSSGDASYLRIDYLTVDLIEVQTQAVVTVTDWEEDVAEQQAVLTLSGDTFPQLAGSNVWCEIDVMREDVEVTSGILRDSNKFVARILLDGGLALTQESTAPLERPDDDINHYYGFDWFVGDNENDTSWVAEGVRIDYYGGYQSDLYFRTSCWEHDGNYDNFVLTYFSGDTKADWQKYEMPLDKQTTLLTPPDDSNPLSWLWYRMRLLVYEVFGWNSFNIAKQRSIIDQQLRTKAPFAYAFAIFDFDTDSVSEASTPEIVLAFPGADDTEVVWDSPEYVEDFLDIIRGIFTVALYLIMIIYAVRLPSRVITK